MKIIIVALVAILCSSCALSTADVKHQSVTLLYFGVGVLHVREFDAEIDGKGSKVEGEDAVTAATRRR
mgnify:CR=1 FL=1